MRQAVRAIVLAGLFASGSVFAALPSASGAVARSASSCRVLTAPKTLGATLLSLHEEYMRYQPDVHNPKITGPVGRVYYGICGSEHYALADFDATYNGVSFGTTDQPERFQAPPGQNWVDIGNTGGDPCGASIPNSLLIAGRSSVAARRDALNAAPFSPAPRVSSG